METTFDIRKKIHEFIDHADERILRIFNAIIASENQEKAEPNLSETFYEELDKRKDRHLTGESASYTWSEVKERARESIK